MRFIIAAILFSQQVVFAAEPVADPSAAARLRKLSLSLRGEVPSKAEFEAVNKTSQDQLSEFLKKKSKEYISSRGYIEKMQERLQSLFRLQLSDRVQTDKSQAAIFNDRSFNALDQLFMDIVRTNSSWDNLLISKKYKAFDITNSDMMSDVGFLKAAFPEQIGVADDGAMSVAGPQNSEPVKNRSKEPSVVAEVEARSEEQKMITAGAITTSRFFNRYPTTKVNKNRKRAAAVFRIFLCDDLRPVVLSSTSDDMELLARALQDGTLGDGMTKTDQEKRHGSDPDCKSCHYKLDPMADTFKTSSLVLNPQAAAGALTYKRNDGSLLSIPVSGLGEMAAAIVQQPEYAQCQVKHFWNWFIGKDVVLTDSRRAELVTEFNNVGRRPNDFVEYLVSQPEYVKAPQNELQDITLANVKPLLQQCHQCHSGEGNNTPEFFMLPIGGTLQSHQEWLVNIADKLDLAHDGAEATMPPQKKSDWRLTKAETLLIKRWISEGAKDDMGQPTITSEVAESIVPGSVASIVTKIEPTFDDTFFRYYENHDLFRVFGQFFGGGDMSNTDCRELTETNLNIIGVKSPIDGQPVFKTPSPSYLRLVQNCALKEIESHANSVAMGFTKVGSFIYISPAILAAKSQTRDQLASSKWSTLTAVEKNSLISFMINQLIGPKVLSPERMAKKSAAIRSAITQDVTVEQALKWVASMIVASKDFLTY